MFAPGTDSDRRLAALVGLTTLSAFFHHVEALLRPGHPGWPLGAEVTVFTFSLAIYPITIVGVFLAATERVGPWYWSVAGLLGLAVVGSGHLGPWATTPPQELLAAHGDPAVGVVAVVLVVVLFGCLFVTTVYATWEWIQWWRRPGEFRERDREV